MIYFENVQLSKDKILTGIGKSTDSAVKLSLLSITTQTYFQTSEYTLDLNPSSVFETGDYIHSNETNTEWEFRLDLKKYSMTKVENEVVSTKDFDFKKDLIILALIPLTEDTIENIITDCSNKTPATAMVYDKYCFYKKGLAFLKDFCDECSINKDFIDFILKQNALDLAILCGNVYQAIKLWNWFFGNGVNGVKTKTCGCHG